MKLSVSLPDTDVAFLDGYARRSGAASRSAVVHRALDALRRSELEAEYAEEWAAPASSEVDDWTVTVADGLEAV